MPLPKAWCVERSESLQDCAVFSVRRDFARAPSGALRPIYCIDAAPWVNVVPFTSAGELICVRQYRHGARKVTLEIPGGIVDPGEAPATAAAQELLEETGFRAREVLPLGAVNPNPALFSNCLHTFLALGAERVADVQNTEFEETHVELVPRAEIPRRVRAGDVDHALVLAGLYWFEIAERAEPVP